MVPLPLPLPPWQYQTLSPPLRLQISPTEVRLYYDTFGPAGRWLCVAVSHDGGVSFTKPTLGLIPFNGSTANNIIAGMIDQSCHVFSPGAI